MRRRTFGLRMTRGYHMPKSFVSCQANLYRVFARIRKVSTRLPENTIHDDPHEDDPQLRLYFFQPLHEY